MLVACTNVQMSCDDNNQNSLTDAYCATAGDSQPTKNCLEMSATAKQIFSSLLLHAVISSTWSAWGAIIW